MKLWWHTTTGGYGPQELKTVFIRQFFCGLHLYPRGNWAFGIRPGFRSLDFFRLALVWGRWRWEYPRGHDHSCEVAGCHPERYTVRA